jgi:hypothetical protein
MQVIKTDAGGAFKFAIEGEEKVYTLPYMTALPLSQIRKLAAANVEKNDEEKALKTIDAELDILRGVMGDKADELTADQVRLIFEAWTAEGKAAEGVGLGE